jgi:hypothetical protein
VKLSMASVEMTILWWASICETALNRRIEQLHLSLPPQRQSADHDAFRMVPA